jgi:hypothetical protein
MNGAILAPDGQKSLLKATYENHTHIAKRPHLEAVFNVKRRPALGATWERIVCYASPDRESKTGS